MFDSSRTQQYHAFRGPSGLFCNCLADIVVTLMTPYSLGNISKRLVEALAIAIVYIATAQLGFLVAIPPGNVTVIWPPSGIALTAMLLLGSRAWAGIWLGSFLVNVFFLV